MYVENKCAGETPVIRGISDDEFIRGKTPMTKEEIRAISIRKLGLSADSVLYDIGAGTGSVSVEAALLHPDIKVFAIERNDEAAELIKKNKEKFCADNITVIKGEASEVLGKMAVSEIAAPKETWGSGISASASECSDIGVEGKLLVPTHAFIGGSGGNMRAIIDLLKQRNPNVRIVINCVTLETLTEVLAVIKEGDFAEPDIVQVSASRYRKVGEYHMADAINPVYIVTVSGI
jgi:precorrin-6Y C5,15-methyltransferase (decarboxylating)